MRRRLIVIAAALLAGACGQKSDLRPTAVTPPPVAYGRERPQTVGDLLTPPPQAAPVRSIELHTRSEPRADDPFELPPKD